MEENRKLEIDPCVWSVDFWQLFKALNKGKE